MITCRYEEKIHGWKRVKFLCRTNVIAGVLFAIGAVLIMAGQTQAAEIGKGWAPSRPLGVEVAQACGHYIILGCFRKHADAVRQMDDLGGPGIGGAGIAGSRGTQVVHTNDFPNFSNGWYCVADGPYPSRSTAMSIAWKEAVPDAYVKNGC